MPPSHCFRISNQHGENFDWQFMIPALRITSISKGGSNKQTPNLLCALCHYLLICFVSPLLWLRKRRSLTCERNVPTSSGHLTDIKVLSTKLWSMLWCATYEHCHILVNKMHVPLWSLNISITSLIKLHDKDHWNEIKKVNRLWPLIFTFDYFLLLQ